MPGRSSASGYSARTAAPMASHMGVSSGEAEAGEPPRTCTSTRSASSSPRARRRCSATVSSVSPGSVRMSTSRSTRSGMTLVLMPPWARLGENVVWVQDQKLAAAPREAIPAMASAARAGVDQRLAHRGGQVEGGRPAAPQLGDLGPGAVLGQAADDLGRHDQRVVGPVGHRSVPRRAPHDQAAPGEALLGHVHEHVAAARAPARPARRSRSARSRRRWRPSGARPASPRPRCRPPPRRRRPRKIRSPFGPHRRWPPGGG